MVIQNYFNFENSSFVVHFTLDQMEYFFLGYPAEVAYDGDFGYGIEIRINCQY